MYSGTVTNYLSWSTAALDASHGEGPSWQVEPSLLRSRSAYGGVSKYGRVEYVYDSGGPLRRLINVRDWGRVDSAYGNIAGDDGNHDHACAVTSYTAYSARFITGLPHRQTVFSSSDCASGLLSDTRTFYDGQAGVSDVASPPAPVAPTAGNVTAVWRSTGGGVVDDGYAAEVAVVERSTYEPNGYAGASSSWARPATVTDARGFATSYAYAPHSSSSLGTKTVTTMNALGFDTQVHFDVYGRVVRQVDLNDRSSYVCYDAVGRATRVYEPGVPGGSTCTASPSVEYRYVPSSVAANQPGAFTTATRWAIQTRTLFALDADAFNALGSGDQYLESWANFDGFGRVAQTNTPSPTGGRIVVRTRYDSQDNPLYVSAPFRTTALTAGSEWAPDGYSAIPRDVRTTFDSIGRPTLVEQLDNFVAIRSQRTTYSAERIVEYAAEATGSPAYGLTARYLDADGNVWRVAEYDNAGTNTNTFYQFDVVGRLVKITDAAGSVTSMAYNQLGWRTVLNDPDAGRSVTTHNQTGAVSDSVDAKGTRLWYRYDRLGRLVGVFNNADLAAGHRWALWVYDTAPGGIGALNYVDAFDPTSPTPTAVTTRTQTTAFDVAGRPATQVVTVFAANSPTVSGDEALDDPYTVTTRYTRTGAVYETVYPGVAGSNVTASETVTTTYNTLGMPVSSSGAYSTGDTFWYAQAIAYDEVARPVQAVLGPPGSTGGMIVNTSYQLSDGRLSVIEALAGDANVDGTVYLAERLQTDTYRYDAPGNPTQITHVTQWDSETECFDYDGRQRLAEAYTLAYPDLCPDPAAAHGVAGPNPYGDTYTVNTIGNITSFDGATRSHGATVTGCQSGTQPTKPHALTTHAVAGDHTVAFTYDCNGAVTTQTRTGTDPEATTYTWDQRQRLTAVTSDVDGTTANLYDTTNNRVVRTDPDGTKTVYLGNTEIRYTPGSPATLQLARSYGQARLGFDGTLTFYSTNHQGSITATNNANDASRLRYTPYGSPRTLTGATNSLDDRNFLGQPDDPDTDSNYLNNRHYTPGLGTFLSVDPIAHAGNPSTISPYVYSRANPISLSDLSGLDPAWAWDKSPCNDYGYYECRKFEAGPSTGSKYVSGPGARQMRELAKGVGVPPRSRPQSQLAPGTGDYLEFLETAANELGEDVREVYFSWNERYIAAVTLEFDNGTAVRTVRAGVNYGVVIDQVPAAYAPFARQLGEVLSGAAIAYDAYQFGDAIVSSWRETEGETLVVRSLAVTFQAGVEAGKLWVTAQSAAAGAAYCAGGGPILAGFCAGAFAFGAQFGINVAEDILEPSLSQTGDDIVDGLECLVRFYQCG